MYLTPLLGAYLADAVMGRFWVILVFSCVYFIVSTHCMLHAASAAASGRMLRTLQKTCSTQLHRARCHRLCTGNARHHAGQRDPGHQAQQVPTRLPAACRPRHHALRVLGACVRETGALSGALHGTLAICARCRALPPTACHACCPPHWQAFMYLTAVGSGGIKPCVSSFGGDQFRESSARERCVRNSSSSRLGPTARAG